MARGLEKSLDCLGGLEYLVKNEICGYLLIC